MPETHIVHATATFSELGIAAASVLLADLPKWRKISDVDPTDPIARNNFLVAAKRLGCVTFWIVKMIVAIPLSLNKVIFVAPFLSFAFGIYALIGISHYPTVFFKSCSFICFENSTLDMVYWWMAIISFTIAMLSAVVERTRARASGEALEATLTEF